MCIYVYIIYTYARGVPTKEAERPTLTRFLLSSSVMRDRLLTPTPTPRGFTKLPECVGSQAQWLSFWLSLAVGVGVKKANPDMRNLTIVYYY